MIQSVRIICTVVNRIIVNRINVINKYIQISFFIALIAIHQPSSSKIHHTSCLQSFLLKEVIDTVMTVIWREKEDYIYTSTSSYNDFHGFLHLSPAAFNENFTRVGWWCWRTLCWTAGSRQPAAGSRLCSWSMLLSYCYCYCCCYVLLLLLCLIVIVIVIVSLSYIKI